MKAGIAVLFACALAFAASSARAEVVTWSRLGLPPASASLTDGPLLAQRAIDRQWGASEDSTYREVDVPGWKSEGLALTMSGLVPGAGHFYTGERSGWLYLVAEGAFWYGWVRERDQAKQALRDAAAYVGDPNDTSSVFAFHRYTRITGYDTDYLQQLWQADRNAYYRVIASDPTYITGWQGPASTNAQQEFADLFSVHDTYLRRQAGFAALVWVNHIVAALDAWRAARAHNTPLRQEYHLELTQRWSHGEPGYRAALVRRF